MKKLITLTLICILAAGLFGGCAGKAESAAASEGAETTAGTDSASLSENNDNGNEVDSAVAEEAADADNTDSPDNDDSTSDEGAEEKLSLKWLMDMVITDLDGNEVRTGDLVAPNKVTMINFWATFCGPCIQEMPQLGELERKYKDQGFEILGITCDIVDSKGNLQKDLIEEARSICEVTGVSYPILAASLEMNIYTGISSVPTTIFVNADGELICDPVVGAPADETYWETFILELMENAE